VKFGLYGLHKGENVAPQALARRARLAEDAGFESIWVGDHIALPADAPDPADEPRLEAVVALSHLAALTSRIRLAFGVIILPQRQPVLMAKQIASIDVLSKGRLIVGIGAGYVEPELHAMGVTLAERGARVDEYLEAMRVLWDEPTASFDGRFVGFAGVMSRPRPVQRPYPPLVLGGHSAAAMRRAARVGAGWFGWELSPNEVADAVARLRAAERPAALGDLEITVTPHAGLDLDLVRRYAEAGVDRLVLQPRASTGAAAEELIAAASDTLIDRV
jgi:probable F420-dependent oxidoreductase